MLHNVTTTDSVDTFRLSAATSQRGPHLFSTQQLSSCIDRQYLLTRGQFSATVQPVWLLTSQLVSSTRLWFTRPVNTRGGARVWKKKKKGYFNTDQHGLLTHWVQFTESGQRRIKQEVRSTKVWSLSCFPLNVKWHLSSFLPLSQ